MSPTIFAVKARPKIGVNQIRSTDFVDVQRKLQLMIEIIPKKA